jgi:subtilisin family serine protease
MSFGFTEEQLDIRAAITAAHFRKNEQILFFAAAANEGANEPEMYPARDDRVIAVRATDYQGHWWRSNPPVGDDQHWSFMTLGQNLPSVSRDESLTGTSYATPIAAGFAAMILADARRLLDTSSLGYDLQLVNRLSRLDGMRQILRRLSVDNTAQRCSYLRPMDLIRKVTDERLALLKYGS